MLFDSTSNARGMGTIVLTFHYMLMAGAVFGCGVRTLPWWYQLICALVLATSFVLLWLTHLVDPGILWPSDKPDPVIHALNTGEDDHVPNRQRCGGGGGDRGGGRPRAQPPTVWGGGGDRGEDDHVPNRQRWGGRAGIGGEDDHVPNRQRYSRNEAGTWIRTVTRADWLAEKAPDAADGSLALAVTSPAAAAAATAAAGKAVQLNGGTNTPGTEGTLRTCDSYVQPPSAHVAHILPGTVNGGGDSCANGAVAPLSDAADGYAGGGSGSGGGVSFRKGGGGSGRPGGYMAVAHGPPPLPPSAAAAVGPTAASAAAAAAGAGLAAGQGLGHNCCGEPWWNGAEADAEDDVIVHKYCTTCHIWRPARGHHCKECGYCMDHFDHHCGTMGNCVARLNHRFFASFMVLAKVESALAFGGCAWRLKRLHFPSSACWSHADTYVLLVLAAVAVYHVLMLGFGTAHLCLITLDVTTKDCINEGGQLRRNPPCWPGGTRSPRRLLRAWAAAWGGPVRLRPDPWDLMKGPAWKEQRGGDAEGAEATGAGSGVGVGVGMGGLAGVPAGQWAAGPGDGVGMGAAAAAGGGGHGVAPAVGAGVGGTTGFAAV
ncbi:hypothetical protein HYH03_008941 [Edaphochlamys debaryana]|uniref:S-acyltransferase n=1 Tax=Edaphochlamys debaryana TaxID=47281 RepID=A0A836BYX4_9CHLO|nr:hypothetical protein HYH03_008941 [Edaphochlamys debaryana]|eukprot:KAG2492778.1 hypothetical protein HYH03_008941 [Edaphochlamys debaryana]